MKLFTKLALVSAIAVSGSAMAMESMDDSTLSATTGQEGITVKIAAPDGIKINALYLHDDDGLTLVGTAATTGPTAAPASADYNGGSSTAGAIKVGVLATGNANQKLNGITITQTNLNPLLKLDIDSDGGTDMTATNGPVLNIKATVGAAKIDIGEISVVKSNAKPTGTAITDSQRRGGTNTTPNKGVILSGLTLDMGDLTANVQLGSTPQGAMINIQSKIATGLNISNLSLKDSGANGGGDIVLDSIKVVDQSKNELSLNSKISVKTDGLSITDSGVRDIFVSGIHLGAKTNASIGDLEIHGLTMGTSTITVTGH